ncbi:MAG: fatty acid desaturase [Planctomycetes bacterium]|nr:fatty acid desaturase [Planctomycetota bacterium]
MSNTLEAVTQEQIPYERWSRPVAWYRTPIDPALLKKLHQRSDVLGALQTFGYLGVLACTGGLALYSMGRWPWWATVLLVFLHGTCFAFQINAVHELGHGAVFRTRWLNAFFERVFAFLGWINFHMFDTSHVRHHQFTLHPPDDLEVVLPTRITVKQFFKGSFVNPLGIKYAVQGNLRIARGRFCGEWELALFPESYPQKRLVAVRWARILLIGHALIVGASIAAGFTDSRFWLLPVLTSFAPFYGTWLFFLCNNTQHIGLQDNVPDFRLSCRTFTVNPFVQFLYWHMNYHTEHHMYAAVPCYRLGELHRAIRHDLPPCPRGIVSTWKEIAAIQKIQKANPQYQHAAPCPNPQPRSPARSRS